MKRICRLYRPNTIVSDFIIDYLSHNKMGKIKSANEGLCTAISEIEDILEKSKERQEKREKLHKMTTKAVTKLCHMAIICTID